MFKIYFDTGVLLKLYSLENNSAKAIALVHSHGAPICFTGLQHSELRNALNRKCGRGEITRKELRATFRNLTSDIDSGLLRCPEVDWNNIFSLANRITDRYAISTHCRTLDVLHVATTLTLGIPLIGTTDERQKNLAHKTGLKVITL